MLEGIDMPRMMENNEIDLFCTAPQPGIIQEMRREYKKKKEFINVSTPEMNISEDQPIPSSPTFRKH